MSREPCDTAALIPDWPAPAGVHALSTLRMRGDPSDGATEGVSRGNYASLNLGAHVGDEQEAVAENRRRLRDYFRLPSEPRWLRQVHGAGVVDLDAHETMPESAEADAAVTRLPNRICTVLTADCLPVLFADRGGRCVAAAHAGWRGLLAGVLEATIRSMPVPAAQVITWLGPAIGPANFEVGAEVRAPFVARDPGAAAAFHVNGRGRFQADLYALARLRLGAAGVSEVYGGGECTFAQAARFFSHRRQQPTGRQATLIWLA